LAAESTLAVASSSSDTGPKAEGNGSPDRERDHSVSHKVIASLSFPNAAPFDARRLPFSGTARVSQVWPSELIPCIRRQIREIELTVRDPQRCGCGFLPAPVRPQRHGKFSRGKSELIRRGLLIQANKLVICAYGDPLRLERAHVRPGKVWARIGGLGDGAIRDHWRDRIRNSARQPMEPTAVPNIPALARRVRAFVIARATLQCSPRSAAPYPCRFI